MTISPTQDAFGAFLNQPINKAELDLSKSTLIECIQAKIEVRQRLSPRYGKQLFSLIKAITTLEQKYGITIYPAQINEVFWSHFIPFLAEQSKAASTIRTICSQLKAAIEWSSHYQAPISPSYNLMKLPKVNHKKLSLTPDDISRIYHFDLDSLKKHKQHIRNIKRVKDMFCLMCNTGLRYSDARRLKKEHFTNDVIDIMQQKTQEYAHVDIPNMCIHREMISEILQRYDYEAPYSQDLSNFDKWLHELLDLCKFDTQVLVETVKDGEITSEYKPKKELVSSHTGRRSFVVYNALRGKATLEIMRATGHKTFSAFQKYLCYS